MMAGFATDRRAAWLLAAALAAATLACGGPKRPPAVVTEAPATSSAAETAGSLGQPQSELVDSGPDVQPVAGEGALGQDLAAADAATGGPLADVLFGFDTAELSPEAQAQLAEHARWLKQHPTVHVTIEGHCDERGTVEYNLALGEQRARVARDYLAERGIESVRLTTVSYGKERPCDSSSDEAAWARNRRAHFVVLR
ncbi:MAG: peptidoglycan-associated lipoprotein Pal [Vicinamibacteria bacterium]